MARVATVIAAITLKEVLAAPAVTGPALVGVATDGELESEDDRLQEERNRQNPI